MTVTDEQVATLRAYLARDFEEYQRLWTRLDKEAAGTGYPALVAAGFFEAVDRRFVTDGEIADTGEVIEFVADVRARYEAEDNPIDPQVAERLIRHSLGDGSISDLASEEIAHMQIVLLTALVIDARFDTSELDKFLAEVRELADEWTS